MCSKRVAPEHFSKNKFCEYFDVSRETCEKLESYEIILNEWQQKINLVSRSTLEDLWHRHFADSAQLMFHSPPHPQTWVDLGAGAGFPGLVLAILASAAGARLEGCRFVLLESDQRKAAFLRQVTVGTGIPVDIRAERIELSTTQSRVETARVVSARALAPLDRLFGLSQSFFEPDTIGLFLKGRDVASEIAEAEKFWNFDCRLEPSLTDANARIAVVRNARAKLKG